MSKEKAIGYAYDSMGKQSSLDNQKKAIEEYCKEQGIELQYVHESSKQPGKDKSENFKEFLENQDVEDVTVVVSQIDRLARDFDSFDEITDLLKAKKATVISTQEGENKYYVVLQIIYGFMLHFIYNYFQDYLECNITLFKPDYVH